MSDKRRFTAKNIDGVWTVLEDGIAIWEATGRGNPRKAARDRAASLQAEYERKSNG